MLTSTRSSRSGVPLAIEGSPDGGTDVWFVHATGFCKELWRPVVGAVVERDARISWASLDQRGHGSSGPATPPYRWEYLATDVIDVVPPTAPIGVGHSSGGAAVAMAQILAPGTFSSLVLIEPIISPPPFERRDINLARVAERRRSTFPNRDAARERFARGPFSTWDPRVLDLYIEYGLVPDPGRITLACRPEVEADFYREGSNHDTWDRVGEIEVPVTIVVGEHSDTHTGPYLEALVGRFANAELMVIPGAGHLVPMERPAVIGGIVAEAVAADR